MKIIILLVLGLIVLNNAVNLRQAKTIVNVGSKIGGAVSKMGGNSGSGDSKNCRTSNKGDSAAAYAGQIAGKIAGRVAGMAGGAVASAVVGGLTMALGFIGDAVQRDKCKLLCCPTGNLKGSWACKYQNKATCNGHYSDYPGHGDHACWWNEALNRCEVGIVCRDKTFNFFALFGSTCPPCDKCVPAEPQWSRAALRKLDLPQKFYVNPAQEFLWCAPRGSPGDCQVNKNKQICEISYADHDGDKNCVWRNGRCVPGAKCDNARERVDAATKLGLRYYDGAWRRNGAPITYTTNYNHMANRNGSTRENRMALRQALDTGFSPSFKNCINKCGTSNNLNACVQQCINNYKANAGSVTLLEKEDVEEELINDVQLEEIRNLVSYVVTLQNDYVESDL